MWKVYGYTSLVFWRPHQMDLLFVHLPVQEVCAPQQIHNWLRSSALFQHETWKWLMLHRQSRTSSSVSVAGGLAIFFSLLNLHENLLHCCLIFSKLLVVMMLTWIVSGVEHGSLVLKPNHDYLLAPSSRPATHHGLPVVWLGSLDNCRLWSCACCEGSVMGSKH